MLGYLLKGPSFLEGGYVLEEHVEKQEVQTLGQKDNLKHQPQKSTFVFMICLMYCLIKIRWLC